MNDLGFVVRLEEKPRKRGRKPKNVIVNPDDNIQLSVESGTSAPNRSRRVNYKQYSLSINENTLFLRVTANGRLFNMPVAINDKILPLSVVIARMPMLYALILRSGSDEHSEVQQTVRLAYETWLESIDLHNNNRTREMASPLETFNHPVSQSQIDTLYNELASVFDEHELEKNEGDEMGDSEEEKEDIEGGHWTKKMLPHLDSELKNYNSVIPYLKNNQQINHFNEEIARVRKIADKLQGGICLLQKMCR